MKKQLLVLFLLVTLFACKNGEEKEATEKEGKNPKSEASAKLKTFNGEFIYVADGAVLKGTSFIYGVTIDEKMQELAAMVAPIKKDEFDMVPVQVKGELVANPLFANTGEGWRLNITIKEIVNVSDTPSPADVRIEEKKTK
jgi:hypothetical protein